MNMLKGRAGATYKYATYTANDTGAYITWNVKAFMPSSPVIVLACAHSAHALSANSTVRGIYFVATFGLKAGTRILRS